MVNHIYNCYTYIIITERILPMNRLKAFYTGNTIYLVFSYIFTFFLLCSLIFGHGEGLGTFTRLLLTLIITAVITPFTAYLIIRLSNISIVTKQSQNSIIDFLYQRTFFYAIAIFLMQLPVFLSFYPGICYYDVGVQVEQYESGLFITNHPLLHTLFMGFFKNLFENPNTGYAIATIIQMIIVNTIMAYAISFLYKKTKSIILCTISMLFYGLFPVNSLLTISTTKDILFAAFALVFFIDCLQFLQNEKLNAFIYFRIILNAVLMLLFRNNALYAFIPTFIIILIMKILKKEPVKSTLLLFVLTFLIFFGANKALTITLNATNGSIKEMMSIPAQEQARIYLLTDNEEDKNLILSYIAEPETYNYYLSDAIKQQLPFEIWESKCKYFLLHSAILNLKYPIICIDAVLYNTQGYWDLFHSPYQSDHYFLSTTSYRGGAVFDSKCQALADIYVNLFHVTEEYQHNPFAVLFLNSGIYIWLMLFCLIKSIHTKNRQWLFSLLFPFFYLLTLCLGPGAIIRYTFVYILMAPVLVGTFCKTNRTE